jgi:predicted CXXCH cytochrome family protein
MFRRTILFCIGAVVCLLPALAGAELADSSCYECHKTLRTDFASGTIHEPVADGSCDSCHADHGKDNKLVLTSEVPGLCWDCHEEMKESHLHEPVAEGNCLDCHAVHHAPEKGLLTKGVPDLCADCHDVPQGKGSTHEPVSGGDCLDCHTSHQSPQDNLLTKDTPDLCAECHSDTDKSEGKNPHEPVAGGECGECHRSHQSDQKNLLKEEYNQERYSVYSEKAYSLCFTCHDAGPFGGESPEGTEFRHGKVNLHFLHVAGKEEVNKYGMKKKKEGLTCAGCHVTHGTRQSKLVRPSLECGQTFCYTLNFRKFEGGGSCVVGCHKPKVYRSRESAPPIPEPQPEAPEKPLAKQGENPVPKP